ncbi:hypothetical protein COP2_041961 [Malus domestica]
MKKETGGSGKDGTGHVGGLYDESILNTPPYSIIARSANAPRWLLKTEGQLYSTVWIQLLDDWVLEQMYTVRPVVETGYENLLLVRLLLEMRMPSIRESSVAEGLTMEGILEKWSELKPMIMAEWGEERDALIHLFGKVRDEWMDEDLTTWIGANRLYPGVPDALRFAS